MIAVKHDTMTRAAGAVKDDPLEPARCRHERSASVWEILGQLIEIVKPTDDVPAPEW
jgi:hypothetical protein